MEILSENKAFGGTQGVYTHNSHSCRCDMTFGLFLPDEARDGPVPVLWYLSGLTCTHENAMTKAAAQGWAAEQGIALVFPDTSPRGDGVADDPAYDLGQGAGFYVNATQDPWAKHFQMWDYITEDLPSMLPGNFALDMTRQAITGHSMGGTARSRWPCPCRTASVRSRPLRRSATPPARTGDANNFRLPRRR